MTREVVGLCRVCSGSCVMKFTLDEAGRIVKARGDHENPVTQGFACIKGLTLHEAHYSPNRLLKPLKRTPTGSFEEIPLAHAYDEIAAKIAELIVRHGPDTIAAFRGTLAYSNLLLPAFLKAIGSKSFYSTMTIDQSAKWVTAGRLGAWAAGKDPFDLCDVLLMTGTNPFVSLTTFGVPMQNPAKRLKAARERGLKVLVIDPRRSETARMANLLVQPLPGEDVAVLAGMIRIILERGWHDAEFCARHVEGLDALRRAVDGFTPDYVAKRAGVPAQTLDAAARMFAEPLPNGRKKRGFAVSGTGANMGPHSNLAEHLVEGLNVICGRFARPGDPISNPGVFAKPRPIRAEVVAPTRDWEKGWRSPVNGYGIIRGEKMTAGLPDEILSGRADRITGLIVDGGNPAGAAPGQGRTVEALKALELLVCVEPFMSNTAKLAHYILPPKMMLERTLRANNDYETLTSVYPYLRYAKPIIDTPPGSELVEEWETPYELARRLGKTLVLDGVQLDMSVRPTSEAIDAIILRNARVPFDQIVSLPTGHAFHFDQEMVQPGDPGSKARLEVAPDDVAQELREVLAEPLAGLAGYTHRLAVRRVREALNTAHRQLPSIRSRMPTNPAYLSPGDMAELGLSDGEKVRLVSPYGSVGAVVEADPDLRSGVVSITHGWGPLPDEAEFDEHGANSNRLTSTSEGRDPINGMPVMTGVPLRIERLI